MVDNEKIEEFLADMKYYAKEKGYTRFQFAFRIMEGDDKRSVDELELDVRPSNALKQNRIFTIQQLGEYVSHINDLKRFKNMGEKSAKQIMNKLIKLHVARNIEAQRPPLDGITLC